MGGPRRDGEELVDAVLGASRALVQGCRHSRVCMHTATVALSNDFVDVKRQHADRALARSGVPLGVARGSVRAFRACDHAAAPPPNRFDPRVSCSRSYGDRGNDQSSWSVTERKSVPPRLGGVTEGDEPKVPGRCRRAGHRANRGRALEVHRFARSTQAGSRIRAAGCPSIPLSTTVCAKAPCDLDSNDVTRTDTRLSATNLPG